MQKRVPIHQYRKSLSEKILCKAGTVLAGDLVSLVWGFQLMDTTRYVTQIRILWTFINNEIELTRAS